MNGPVPTGTVTMLFSDIEGSTRLLTRLGDDWPNVLRRQRELLRDVFGRWRGREMGTEGDSFFVAFESARDGVNACLEAQRALIEQRWPDDARVRVRMGLHTGEPEPYENGYVGLDVHLAARIAATAHGGQIVVSEATRRLTEHRLPEGASLQGLGCHRLKDIAELQYLHQLVGPGLSHDFPPLRSLGTRTNLPSPAYELVGRDHEVAELCTMLSRRRVRLHTLTGPGGGGKTRLAMAVAEAVSERYPDGVYFVPLASVTDQSLVWTTIAEVMGLTGESKSPPTLFDHIASRRMLLVLDNLEQLLDAGASVVGELLAKGPGLSVLATSRRPLHLPGEQEYAVETLTLPPPGTSTVEEALQAGAVDLFVQLARLVRPAFELTAGNVADVVSLCRRLDGLPLALELAAARTKLLTPHALLARLESSVELAAAGGHRPPRHQTLRSTVGWSHQLLSPELKAIFVRLAVFRGGADLDAVAAVTGAADVVGAVAGLVDASLLRLDDESRGAPRVRLLETIRSYAGDQLRATGELEQTRRRHAEHYLSVAESAAEQLRGPATMAARQTIEDDLGNLREALRWTVERSDHADDRVSLGLRLCSALSWFWYTSGYVAEGRQWAHRVSALAADDQGPELATVLHTLAILLLQQGEHQAGRDILAKCLRIWRRIGDESRISLELNSLGLAYRALGDRSRAVALLEESAATARRIGEDRRLAAALGNLGLLELDEGHGERAIEIFAEVERVDRDLGDEWGVAADQVNRSAALVVASRSGEASALVASVAAQALSLGDMDLTVSVIELAAICRAATGDAAAAARLTGAAAALREQSGLPLSAPDAAFLGRHLEPAREAMTGDDWAAQEAVGRRFTAAEALRDGQVLD